MKKGLLHVMGGEITLLIQSQMVKLLACKFWHLRSRNLMYNLEFAYIHTSMEKIMQYIISKLKNSTQTAIKINNVISYRKIVHYAKLLDDNNQQREMVFDAKAENKYEYQFRIHRMETLFSSQKCIAHHSSS